MTTLRQAATALLEYLHGYDADYPEAAPIFNALRAALAEPQTTHWEGCEAVHPECKNAAMDKAIVIALAEQAAFHSLVQYDELIRFAGLVESHTVRTRLLDIVGEAIKRDREECAKSLERRITGLLHEVDAETRACVATVRNRSQT